MMTAEQLKGSILQLAMQGKLVEQRPGEGNGEDLYKEIQVEKKRLVREGKIKKGKDLPKLSEEYDIPDTWKMVHLLSVCESISDIDHKMPKAVTKENGIPFLAAKDINPDMTLNFNSDVKYISKSDFERLRKKAEPREGDIIFSRIGTLGKVGIVNNCTNFLVSYSCCVIRPMFINRKYLAYCLQGPEMQLHAKKAKTGIGVPDLGMGMIKSFAVPLPPLAEQKRIVAKIEELMPFVEQYAAASTKLNTLNATFPEMMKKSILQEAVQGKLVPQDPNDEPASVLLEKIAKEKKRLIKEGKIKKQKPLPEITEDEIPFDIPESWRWVRLGSILKLLTDGTHKTPHYVTDGVPFISVKDMSSGKISFSNTKYITEQEADELNTRCNPEKGDVLLSKVGTTGVPAPVDTDTKFSLFVSVALLKFNTDLINRDYLINVICSPCVQKQCTENTRGVGNKNWVMRDIANTLIPIAPLREQERIVAELQRIMPQFNILEQKMDGIN